jgi:hypothetical protein
MWTDSEMRSRRLNANGCVFHDQQRQETFWQPGIVFDML